MQSTSESDGFVVLSEIYFPGWRASIDGAAATIYRTDYALRGVRVGAGSHVIRFSYRPLSFRLGVLGLVAGLILPFAGLLLMRRLRKV